jgi:hypothetical protein
MPSKLSRRQAVRLCVVVAAVWVGSASVMEAEQKPWHLIRIPDPAARAAAIAALESASVRLTDGDCRKVLTDFENQSGQTLADHLSSLEVDIQTYVRMVTFIDDSRHRVCEKGGLFFTSPGSRVVRVCVDQLKLMKSRPHHLVALFIHEVLHSLGLGESPPSSEAITARVIARCGPK